MKRIDYIDTAKGIATILVILGHLSVTPKIIVNSLYTFHIPLFFLLSGFVLNLDKFSSYKLFILDKIKKIILPYFFLSFFTWLWIYGVRQFPLQITDSALRNLAGIFICAKDTPYYLTLWFIVSLFFAQLLLFICYRLNHGCYMIVKLFICFCVAVLISKIYHPGWIWALDTVPMATFFVGCGFLMKNYKESILKYLHCKYLFILIPILTIFGYLNFAYHGRQDLFYQNIGNPLFYLLTAFTGIWSALIISKVFEKQKVLKYIGKNSLVFYAFHRSIFVPIAMLIVNILNETKIEIFSLEIIQTMICLLIICFGSAFISEIIKRFFPFVIGKSKKTQA